MPEIIRDKVIVDDDWTVLTLAEGEAPEAVAIPAGKIIVPLAVWQAQRDLLRPRGEVGVLLPSDARAESLKDDLALLPVIAVEFPKFSDGRGFSIAYNLRVRLGFTGELRAVGDVLRDQMFYMQRVGFNAFAPRPDRDIREALKSLSDFSEAYQKAWDVKQPLFRRVARGQAAGSAGSTETVRS
ncbi:MAG: DUF934 domain-containing protein [Burkholderiaceae bacterium]